MESAAEIATSPHHRRWNDIKLGRLIGILVVAAVPMGVCLTLIGVYVEYNFPLLQTCVLFTIVTVWVEVCGGLHLLLVRVRGYATRGQCLAWGMMTGFAFAGAIVIANYFIDGLPQDVETATADAVQAGVVGALFVPFGLLSGWIYWRLGIRTSPSPNTDPRVFE